MNRSTAGLAGDGPVWEKITGQVILGVWLLLAIAGVRIGFLRDLQRIPEWKAATGAVILAALLFQFVLSLKRFFPALEESHPLHSLKIHRRMGNWIPLLLLLHTTRWGFGLPLVLTALLMINLAIGWHGFKPGSWYFRWVGVHILLSITVLFLALYHMVIAASFH